MQIRLDYLTAQVDAQNPVETCSLASPPFERVSYTDVNMRYYEQRYPEVDELVMVQVRQIAEMGAYVKLVHTHPQCRDESLMIITL